jgi:superfamily II DNA or RNA helicase
MSKLKITKIDEVYMHIECDRDIAQELKEHFSFKAPGYQFMPSVKAKYWNGDIFLFNPKTNLIYVGLLNYVQNYCKEREYEIEYLTDFSSNEFSIKEAEAFIESLNLPIKPRDYQIDAITHCIRDNRKMLLSPTASGKSLIIYLLIRYYQKKTLIIVPTTALVHQMYSDFEEYGFNSSDNVYKIFGGQDKSADFPIVVSTWQSVYKMPKSWFQQFKVVIGDEAHLFKASSLTSIMSKLDQCKYKIGFTGSLDNTEVNILTLQGLFGSIRKVASTAELIEKKHLSDFMIKTIVLDYPDSIRKKVSKMDYQGEIDYIVRSEERNKFIVNLALSLKGNTLLLFQYVDKHGKPLYEALKKADPNKKIYFISGEISGELRDEIRKTIETESNAIIVASFGTTSTGINIKRLHNLIFASPSKSIIRNLQSIGRVLRKSDHKDISTLYDLADDLSDGKPNYTLLHYIERIKLYNQEKFKYKTYRVKLNI